MPRARVILIADLARPEAKGVSQRVRDMIESHAELVAEIEPDDAPLSESIDAQLAVVVGGDGTLIQQARRLAGRNISLVGVNVGRLGFLAEFDVETLAEHASLIFGSNAGMREHVLLSAAVHCANGGKRQRHLAVNDWVISAGPPFRIIELRLSIDGAEGPVLSGDGMIVATTVGSTAYNVSAGGPIVHPALEAMVVTPLAAHSLAFRSIVLRADCTLLVTMIQTNAGTALVGDGQVAEPLREGDVVEIRAHDRRTRFVTNPATSYWRILQDKLHWAAPPRYRDA